jgi:small-conductance mechanosensitive channel
MKLRNIFGAVLIVALAFCAVVFTPSTLAQCVMCRASLGTNSSFIRNFNIGVGVLLVPPVSIFCTIFILAWRNRRS